MRISVFPACEDHMCSLWQISNSVMKQWAQHNCVESALRTQENNWKLKFREEFRGANFGLGLDK